MLIAAPNEYFHATNALKGRIGLADFAANAGKAFLGRLILVIDVERLGIGTRRLVLLAQAFIGQPATRPAPQIERIELHRLIEILGGRFRIPERQIAKRARY